MFQIESHEKAHSMKHMNEAFEGMQKFHNTISPENATLKDEISTLQAELDGIRKFLTDTESRLLLLEQNTEIKGTKWNRREAQ